MTILPVVLTTILIAVIAISIAYLHKNYTQFVHNQETRHDSVNPEDFGWVKTSENTWADHKEMRKAKACLSYRTQSTYQDSEWVGHIYSRRGVERFGKTLYKEDMNLLNYLANSEK